MDIISVKGLVKRYDDLLALDHFDLRVSSGEIFGLLGPNGSGKTTSINCMLGLLTYDRGSIELFGEAMGPERHDLKRRIGIVPQQVAVFEELTVRENIDYFCSLYVGDRTRRKALVDEAVEFVGLEDFMRFRPNKLSGGLQRRLNIACGIAHRSDLIFFDEPTVAVDPQSRNAILEGIERLRSEGATVVYTSHYMEEVEQVCDRVMIMDHGRVLAQGTYDELERSIRTGERIVIEIGGSGRRGAGGRAGNALPNQEVERVRALPHVLEASLDGDLLSISCEASDHNLADVLAALRAGGANLGRVTCAPPHPERCVPRDNRPRAERLEALPCGLLTRQQCARCCALRAQSSGRSSSPSSLQRSSTSCSSRFAQTVPSMPFRWRSSKMTHGAHRPSRRRWTPWSEPKSR